MPGRAPEDPEAHDASDPAIADTPLPGPGDLGARGKGPRHVRAGDVLGRYQIGEELGEGGMATVFRARDRDLRRDVAVKVLFPHLARRAEVVRRFHREARAAAGLEHPNILRIYDVGGAEGDDPPYIVMELIRGRTLLQESEARGAMLAEVVACIGALLGDALAAAHAAGVIHRDIKPANVLVAPGGRLLLADFGVARLETEDSLVTRTGALLGTPAYMSPEQASGDLATARSDLYSLGATLYQLATGSLPYVGSPARVMSQIAAGHRVAPVRRRPACGPDLSRLIERMMASEPDDRPSDATAIAAELRGLASASGFGDAAEELAAYFEDPDGFLRVRMPQVVGSLVVSARAAIAEDKLPRAMALADRASALAPTEPAVTELVSAVTQGGHLSRRKRQLVIGGIAVGLAGGVTALGLALASSPAAREGTAGSPPSGVSVDLSQPPIMVAPTIDARAAEPPVAMAAPSDGDALGEGAGDVDGERASIDRVPPGTRGGEPPRRSGSPGRAPPPARRGAPSPVQGDPVAGGRDLAALAPDAGLPAEVRPQPVELDAAVVPAVATGHIVVRNDVWCSVWIDGVDRGNHRYEPIEVPAGHHVVRCVNPAGSWTQETDVGPAATRVLTGTLLRELEIRLEVDATINGKPYARGAVVRLKPGIIEVVSGGKKKFITFRDRCTLRDSPELDCYR
ncbi:MAG TPA: protein kinase [Kofleriaceae bacterium]|nr:protein kinase [Kofleriaceae bacterium]